MAESVARTNQDRELFFCRPDFRLQRQKHVERAIRLGAIVLIGQGVLWTLVLGILNVPQGVALHACFVAGGFALLYLMQIGALRVCMHMTFWLMYFYCIGTLVLIDPGGTEGWPKVVHLYLIPIVLGANLVFMDERPGWRIVYALVCIATFVPLERGTIAITTVVALPGAERIMPIATPFNALVAVALTFISLRRFSDDVAVRESQLNATNASIESLLEHMLPPRILARLREHQGTFADQHGDVSILFADIVGFTNLASRLEPRLLVNLLNEIFSRFDHLVEKHGVEKIKTIGDAYMAVSGIPDPRKDHAAALADLANDMLGVIGDYPELNIRVGINSGHVVAGIIGRKRFIYDIWGDAVNLASSMESHGLPSRIQVTEATWTLLKDDFDLEFRGTIQVKTKGNMNTYFLGPRKSSEIHS